MKRLSPAPTRRSHCQLAPTRHPAVPAVHSGTGADLLCECLLAQGARLVFGYPGGAALPLYDALPRHPIRHVLVRHEQNAAFAADGFARASGRPGVCISTSGPGATNLLTGLAAAWMDSVPVVALTGQVATSVLGTLAFQEVDIVSMARPITKAAWQVRRPDDLPTAVAEAFRTAESGRPGPVLLDLPKDVQAARLSWEEPLPTGALDHERDADAGLVSAAQAVAELLDVAERPVLVVGRGVSLAGGTAALRRLARRHGVPVAHTLLGVGAFPDGDPLDLGMLGMYGTVEANLAVHNADLVLAVGARLDDRVAGRPTDFAPEARVVHVDVDPAAFGRCVRADVPILGDARAFLEMLDLLATPRDRSDWLFYLTELRAAHGSCRPPSDGQLTAADAIRAIRTATDAAGRGPTTVVADVGQHQMYAARCFGYQAPDTFFTSGGLGSMGYALGAALGVQLARPGETVWAVVGDGGFQMSAPELTTLAAERVPVKVAVVNNRRLGMVRQWQELYYEANYSHSAPAQPDFVRLAESHGLLGLRASSAEEAESALARALDHPGPAVVELRVAAEDVVYPMVSPGRSLGEVECVDGPVRAVLSDARIRA